MKRLIFIIKILAKIWKLKGKKTGCPIATVLFFERELTNTEDTMIRDYLDGKRFMSRYHGGARKEKVKKERKS